ncbi:family 1 glycosylhydrolase [Nocardioides marmorisolisilvae]|uniref:Glycoside hydrolase family 1 protein n=1 Tax=Nocardioides marmorisolisilvae TaxID=1542737 RepID=A0A3N0DPZ1_9ACTN|nr:family 1 glycosylhydrolase [Nocardioides marmorisolisilvae]RNL77718.1 glycoside hydrolase family 1 protein [Nocardioides marmorisolisilvae]
MRRTALTSAALALLAAVTFTGAGTAGASASNDPPPLPSSFLWGTASAGFQSEGYSPDSNWSRYAAGNAKYDPVGTSVDFLHRYTEDIALAKGLGVKVFRFSVEWARVEPSLGHQDPAAWAFYDNVVAAIKAAGMRPMITLDHWVYPGWEADKGGWARAGMVDDWLAEAKRVVDRYASADPLWVTINEPFAYWLKESQNGGLNPLLLTVFMNRLVQAHNGIYDYIHAHQPGAMVTSNVAYIPTAETLIDTLFLNRVKSRMDFVGVDYYYPVALTDPSGLNAFNGQFWKASLAPEGIYYVLQHYARQFPTKPLYVVENGMPTDNGLPRADGWDRADQLRDTVYWLERAKADGMNVIGYNYWSLTDNYEWGSYEPRFGLYTVDVLHDPTLTRVPTDAVAAYQAITAANGVPAGYTPARAPQFCSLVDFLSSCLDPVRVP